MQTTAVRLSNMLPICFNDDWNIHEDAPAALRLLEACIDERNDPTAMLHLAFLLTSHSLGVPVDAPRAVKLYEQCIVESNSIIAVHNLALIFENGAPGVQQDLQRAETLFQRCIDEENSQFALLHLADLLTEGTRLPQNAPRAVKLYEQYINKFNNYSAMYNLARLLAEGARGVPRDIQRAVNLYQRCIDEDYSITATIDLARLFLHRSLNDERYVERALQLCESNVEALMRSGDAMALALDLANGTDKLDVDLPLAARLCEMCIHQTGSLFAMVSLAEFLLIGVPGLEKDDDRAMILFQSYVDATTECSHVLNIAITKLAVGTIHIERNVPLAMQICELCIDRWDNSKAMVGLAEILFAGAPEGGKDFDRAMALCERSIDGSSDCSHLVELAKLKASGTNIMKRNIPLALRLFELCIDRRADPGAMFHLVRLLMCGAPDIEKDESRIVQLCEMIIDKTSICDDVFDLASEISVGSSDVERDMRLAVRLYEVCVKTNAYAMMNMANILIDKRYTVEFDGERVVQLCERFLDECSEIPSVKRLAKALSRGTKEVERNIPLAIRIYEMCIEQKGDVGSMISVARLLVTRKPVIEWDAERVVQFCVRYLNEQSDHSAVMDLAETISSGTSRVEKHVKLAIRIYDACIEQTNNVEAMSCVAELLLRDNSGKAKDMNRVVTLYERYCHKSNSCDDVLYTARLVARGLSGFEKDVPLAIRLYEICIEKRRDPEARAGLMEILLSDEDGDVEHAMRLCEQSVEEDIYGEGVLYLARRLSSGTLGVRKDVGLAIRMYELCIEKRNNPVAMIRLARMLISGAADIKRDVPRALELCQRHINESDNCSSVLRLADKVAKGKAGFQKDEAAAIEMYEMCITKRKESDAIFSLLNIIVRQTGNETRVMQLCDEYIDCSENSNAILRVADKLSRGPVEMQNVMMAMQICEACVDRKDTDAIFLLVTILIQSEEKDVERIESLCKQCICWGNCDLVVQLARKLMRGWGVSKDNSLAQRLCELCIDSEKDPFATITFAESLLRCDGSELRIMSLCSLYIFPLHWPFFEEVMSLAYLAFKDYKKGQLAADLCENVLKFWERDTYLALLAEIRIVGNGVKKDDEYAISLCKRACKLGGQRWVQLLGKRVLEGKAGGKDIKLGIRILELCENGEGRMALAKVLFLNGDCERAFDLCKICMTFDRHLVVSFARWVSLKDHDIGFAIRLCELCVEMGCRSGMVLLGEILVSGRVERDVGRCVVLCERAVAENLEMNRVLYVARRAWKGEDMEEDVGLAIQLCEMCVKRNCRDGKVLLAEILVCDRGVERDVERSVELCRQYIVDEYWNGCSNMIQLSNRVMRGEGVVKDIELAKRIRNICIDSGMRTADWKMVAGVVGEEREAAMWRRVADVASDSTFYMDSTRASSVASEDSTDCTVSTLSSFIDSYSSESASEGYNESVT